jgi:hypothetical protein
MPQITDDIAPYDFAYENLGDIDNALFVTADLAEQCADKKMRIERQRGAKGVSITVKARYDERPNKTFITIEVYAPGHPTRFLTTSMNGGGVSANRHIGIALQQVFGGLTGVLLDGQVPFPTPRFKVFKARNLWWCVDFLRQKVNRRKSWVGAIRCLPSDAWAQPSKPSEDMGQLDHLIQEAEVIDVPLLEAGNG